MKRRCCWPHEQRLLGCVVAPPSTARWWAAMLACAACEGRAHRGPSAKGQVCQVSCPRLPSDVSDPSPSCTLASAPHRFSSQEGASACISGAAEGP